MSFIVTHKYVKVEKANDNRKFKFSSLSYKKYEFNAL